MDAEQDLVFGAVRQDGAKPVQRLLQKAFAVWFDAFVYNQIWEDPRVDLEALELGPDSRVLTISSGGCNAMNYLLASPERVTAVDLNRHHVALLNLKVAAAKGLADHDAFFDFFARGRTSDAEMLFDQSIAPHLDEATRDYWGSKRWNGRRRINFFDGAGLYEHSRNGYFLRFFHRFAHLVGSHPEKVLDASTPDEQAAAYEKNIAPFFESRFIKLVGRLPVTMFGLGIPPQQYDELIKDVGEGRTVIDVYRERVRRLAVDYPISENYFAWQAFARRYDIDGGAALPEYLKAGNFETLRANADRIETRVGSVTDVIRSRPRGSFNRFVFLDAQDWMDAATMTELWSLVAERAEPGARVIFRTAGAASPIESNLPPDLRARFIYHEERSKNLFARDRASIYGGFHLYELKG